MTLRENIKIGVKAFFCFLTQDFFWNGKFIEKSNVDYNQPTTLDQDLGQWTIAVSKVFSQGQNK